MSRILCFSGTGNSMYVARLLSEALGGGSVESLSGERLRKPSEFEVDADSPSEPVVWVFPTYSWGVPPVVADFIREVSFGKNALMARHYMVTTCGDDMGRADRQWRKLLGRRGITGESAYSVQMPNTYVCMKGFDVDSPEVARAKIESARTRVEAIAGSIISRGRDMLVRGSFAGLKTGVVYPWFVRFAMSPKPFGVTEVCRGCGACAGACPMGNISMVARGEGVCRPEWGDKCAMCLRCYHMCPHGAVSYGSKTHGKGRYTMMMEELPDRKSRR